MKTSCCRSSEWARVHYPLLSLDLNYQNYKDISDNKQENDDIIELINGKSDTKPKAPKRKY